MADGKRARTLKYGDARAFYERTFITEGMGHLLTQVSERLNSKGGEPVIQLQIRPPGAFVPSPARIPIRRVFGPLEEARLSEINSHHSG